LTGIEKISQKLKEVAAVAQILSNKNDSRLNSVLSLAFNKENLLVKINLILTSLRKVGLHVYQNYDDFLLNALKLLIVMNKGASSGLDHQTLTQVDTFTTHTIILSLKFASKGIDSDLYKSVLQLL
jgi:hypothetical protein